MTGSDEEARKMFTKALTSEAMKHEMELIWQCVSGGLQDYNDPVLYSPAAKRDHTASVRAAIRNAHIVGRAKRAAVASPDYIRIRQRRNRTTFVVNDRTEVWFKKLKHNGEPSFRPSDQARAYVTPQPAQTALPLALPPEIVRIIAGYRLNSTATDFAIVVSRPIGNGVYADVELTAREVVQLFVEPAPAPAVAEVVEQVRRRVKIRRGAQGQTDAQERDDADKSIS